MWNIVDSLCLFLCWILAVSLFLSLLRIPQAKLQKKECSPFELNNNNNIVTLDYDILNKYCFGMVWECQGPSDDTFIFTNLEKDFSFPTLDVRYQNANYTAHYLLFTMHWK